CGAVQQPADPAPLAGQPTAGRQTTTSAARAVAFVVVVVSSVFAGWRFADQARPTPPVSVVAAARPTPRTPPTTPALATADSEIARAPTPAPTRSLPGAPAAQTPAVATTSEPAPLEDVISRAMPAVVRVETSGGYGTG